MRKTTVARITIPHDDIREISRLRVWTQLTGRGIQFAARRAVTKAAQRFIEIATELAPKNTTQLSKTIGTYRVDPDTYDEAIYQYGYAEDPSVAINKELKWGRKTIREVGTATTYALKANDRTRFMENSAIILAMEMPEITYQALHDRMTSRTSTSPYRADRI